MMSAALFYEPVEIPLLGGYLGLCLTGCAGVAVLGARRPGVGAWNFVLFGLLAVMLLPVAENLVTEKPLLDPLRTVFLAATVAVGVLNYLPTSLVLAAFLLGLGCALQLVILTERTGELTTLSWWCLALVPWLGALTWKLRSSPDTEFDRIWLDFRDGFGFLWGQRLREQFNRAAVNAGWPVVLRWQGLRLSPGSNPPAQAIQAEIVATLRSMLKRFTEEGIAGGGS
jgi:hypothetical protein